MQKCYLLLFILPLLFSCSKAESSEIDSSYEFAATEELDEGYSDGNYCAEVDYYNPNSGTQSSYTLTVEVADNSVVRVNFPNGGYMDDEISDGALDSSGETSFTNYKGYQYTVKIIGDESGCFESVPMAEQCLGITEDGDQCQNETDNESGYCWQHEDQF